MASFNLNFLISVFDTIECAYYLMPTDKYQLDFVSLAVQKENLLRSKNSKQQAIKLGSEEFLLASNGTNSGYPFVIENEVFVIQFGEFNKPNFYVKFRSIALWHHGALALHKRFLACKKIIGVRPQLIAELAMKIFSWWFDSSKVWKCFFDD